MPHRWFGWWPRRGEPHSASSRTNKRSEAAWIFPKSLRHLEVENKTLSAQTQLSQVNGQQGRSVPKAAPAIDGHDSSPDSCPTAGSIRRFHVPPTAGPRGQLNGLFLPTQSALFRGGSFIPGPYCHCLIRPRFKGARCEMTQIAASPGGRRAPRPVCDRHPLQTEPPQG